MARRRLFPPLVATPLVAALLGLAAAPAHAQSLAERVESVRDGTVLLSFAARPGVCGNSTGGVTIVDRYDVARGDCACDGNAVNVKLTRRDGRTVGVSTRIGRRERAEAGTADLGAVSAPAAADYLLGLAAMLDGRAAKDAILAAVVADSAVTWPGLLEISRNRARPRDVRKTAVFWLGQEAARAVAAELEGIATEGSDDLEVRKAAIFALSRRPADEGVPALIRIARTSPDHELRRTAIFWLGQSDDPRAIDFFEEVLLGKGGA